MNCSRATLIRDGYSAYATYIEKTSDTSFARCRTHTWRQFFDARDKLKKRVFQVQVEPDAVPAHYQVRVRWY